MVNLKDLHQIIPFPIYLLEEILQDGVVKKEKQEKEKEKAKEEEEENKLIIIFIIKINYIIIK